jgi:hypothetical protein
MKELKNYDIVCAQRVDNPDKTDYFSVQLISQPPYVILVNFEYEENCYNMKKEM